MDPYLGQIGIFAFGTIPRGWVRCDGRLLSIQQNSALFSLIGTYYGGDGRTTFQLPNLGGIFPRAAGNAYELGEFAGSSKVALSWADMPPHNHGLQTSSLPATTGAPGNAVPGAKGRFGRDLIATADTSLESSALGRSGSGVGHENMPPYLALTFAIAVSGIFPSRT